MALHALLLLDAFKFKVCEQFSRTVLFRRNCFNAKLEKNKNLFAQQTFLSAVDTQSFRSVFHAKFCQRFLRIEETNRREVGFQNSRQS